MTLPAVIPFNATEQTPFARVHDAELRVTEPVPLWDQVTVPVVEYPATLALHVMNLLEPAARELGVQETVVFDSFWVTVRLNADVYGGSESGLW
jgi:hypothetical protein